MRTEIGRFDPATGQVPVTFTSGTIKHERRVNACLGANGKYDAKATAARVAEVATGVAAKIEAGVLGG